MDKYFIFVEKKKLVLSPSLYIEKYIFIYLHIFIYLQKILYFQQDEKYYLLLDFLLIYLLFSLLDIPSY